MAKSKKPRKPYRRPDFKAEAAALNPEKYSIDSGETLHLNPNPPKKVPVDKEPPAPAHPHVVHPAAPQAVRGAGRYLVPVAAGAGVVGGGAYLAHRARRRKAEMSKGLIDPTTGDRIVFEKRYLEDDLDEAPRGVLVSKADREKKYRDRKEARRVMLYDERLPKVNVFDDRAKAYRRAKPMRQTFKESMKAQGRGAVEGGAGGAAVGAAYGGLRHHRTKLGAAVGAAGGAYVGSQVRGVSHANKDRRDRLRILEDQGTLKKRSDETALQHHGSRRMRKLPVSSVRVAGLPVQSARFSRGNPELIPGTRSHANKLTHVHNGRTANRTGKLFVVHRKARSKSGSSVGKSAGYAQSGGSGRRLVNV